MGSTALGLAAYPVQCNRPNAILAGTALGYDKHRREHTRNATMPAAIILEFGQRFGRWTYQFDVESKTTPGGVKKRQALFRCECGTVSIVDTNIVRSGQSQSCGCLHRERVGNRFRKHGATGSETRGTRHTRAYRSWSHMHDRVRNPNTWSFEHYGGRGIQVCERWSGRDGFKAFLSDMGERPEGKTLDRFPDIDGDYEPGNCRWATHDQQMANRRCSYRWIVGGVEYDSARKAGEACGLSLSGMMYRCSSANFPEFVRERRYP